MDDAVEYFKAITGAADEVARQYLDLTENIPEQAIQLFFDSPDLASGLGPTSSIPVSSTSAPAQHQSNISFGRRNVESIDLDPDNATDIESDVYGKTSNATRQVIDISNNADNTDIEDDESIARRIQAEIYQNGDVMSSDVDGIRAPIERRREVLVGEEWPENNMQASSYQQIRAAPYNRPGRLGVFNQTPVPSIWDPNVNPSGLWRGLSQATGGASETSSKAARLAELFRPPFEIMRQIPWEMARDQGKKEKKWIMVNVQDQSIFDCQQLNRDIWKDSGIKEAIREHFIFIQYSKDDPKATQYMQYYFQSKDNDDAYPHITIVDPRTGEQVKSWSGRPVPQATDFLMQIYEFLENYSLDISKKNPVANRKSENQKDVNIQRLTEEEMLDIALKNSLTDSKDSEPPDSKSEDLTRKSINVEKGKSKEVMKKSPENEPSVQETPSILSFAQISTNKFHIEPPMGPEITRIQFKHAGGRIVRLFNLHDPVRRIYEWLKSDPLEGRSNVEFELKGMGKNLIAHLDETIENCGLKNGTVMIEFLESDD